MEFSVQSDSPSIDDLDVDIRNKFLGLMMDYTEEYFIDVELETMVYDNLRILLKTNSPQDKEILADSLTKAFHDKYKEEMQRLLDEEYACELIEKEQDDLLDAGYRAKTDRQTGETYYEANGKSAVYLG